MMDMPQIGKRIRDQRDLYGMTQEELAEKVGCNAHYISQIENGRRRPSSGTLVSLSEQLHMSLDYMVFGTIPAGSCPPSLTSLIELCTPDDLERLELFAKALIEFERSKTN